MVSIAVKRLKILAPKLPILQRVIENGTGYTSNWRMQEPTGVVALATNIRVETGRNVVSKLYADYVPGVGWSDGGGGVADCDGTQVASSSLSQTIGSNWAVGLIWESTLTVTNYVAGNVKAQLGSSGNGTNRSANGVYVENILGSTGNKYSVVADVDFVGSIDLTLSLIKQTNIAASSDFPEPDVIVNGTFAADTDWTKGDAAITIAEGKATWSGAQAGNADLTATVAPLTSGIRYKQYIVLSGVTAGTVTPIFGTQVGTALDTDGIYPLSEVTANGAAFLLRGNAAFTGSCELVKIQPANPLNIDWFGGITLAQSGNPKMLMVDVNGTTGYGNLKSAEYNSIHDPNSFADSLFIQKDTADWDAVERYFYSLIIDANNWIKMGGTATIGQLVWEIRAGGVTEQILLASGSPTSVFDMGIQSDGTTMGAIYKGQIIETMAIANTVIGNYASMVAFAENAVPQKVHRGKGANLSHSNAPKSADQWARESHAGGVG